MCRLNRPRSGWNVGVRRHSRPGQQNTAAGAHFRLTLDARRLPPKMRPPQPTAEHVLSAVVHASGISLDTLLGRRSRHEIARAIAAVILRSEAGLTAKEAGSTLRRSRQSVHNLIAKAAPGGDPAAAELVTQVREALYPALLSVPQSSLDGPGAPCSPGAGDDALRQPPNATVPSAHFCSAS